jgi:integrase
MAALGSITPPRGLTPAFIDALRPREGSRYEIADRRAPGLRLRVLESGGKVFRWYCTARGKVVTIGPWSLGEQPGHVTLAQAREWLERLKAAHAAGALDTVEAELATHLRRRSRVADPTPEDRRLFGAVAEEFYADDIQRNRKRPEDARAILDRDVLPALAARPIGEITTLDVRDVVKRTITRGAAAHAGKVLATMKQLFGWAQANGFTDKNPAAPLKGRHLGVQENRRDRWLTAEEIPAFWRALDAAVLGDPTKAQKLRPATAAALRLLLLTAARTGELLRARWTDVDLDAATWTIPVENQKLTRAQERRARPFVIPLPPTAVALFEVLRDQADGAPWVLPGRGRANGAASRRGHYDEKTLGHAVRRLVEAKILALPGGPVTPHDLRRSARTHLAKLRVPHWIVERVLNHSLGKIVETYDQNDYLDERREALERWDAYVARLVAPGSTNVVVLGDR